MKIETAVSQVGEGALGVLSSPRKIGMAVAIVAVAWVVLVVLNKYASGYTPEAVANRI